MTQTISRLYASPSNAASVVSELKESGFDDTAIHVVAPSEIPPATEAGSDGMAGPVAAAPVIHAPLPEAHAKAYAERVGRGETLVSVVAPFGYATTATTIMDRHDPAAIDLPDPGYEMPVRDPAAPLSSALGWRVLSHDPTPLSSLLRWPTLSARQAMPRKSDRELVDDPAPFSKKVGMEVLSPRPTPLSARFGWRVLLDNPTPLSTRFGWKVLTDQAPPAKRLGMDLLSDDPAPLSRKLGWRLLSNDPTPLSTWFGWRVLSSDPMPATSWFRRWIG